MQEGVLAPVLAVVDAGHRRVGIGQVGVVFGVLVDPAAGDDLQRFHRLALPALGEDVAEEATHFFLGGIEHAPRLAPTPKGACRARPLHCEAMDRLENIETFVRVAQTQSFAEAARQMRVAKSVVTTPREAARGPRRRAALPPQHARGAAQRRRAGLPARLHRARRPGQRRHGPDARRARRAHGHAAHPCADRLRARPLRVGAARLPGQLSRHPPRTDRERHGGRSGQGGRRLRAADLSGGLDRAGVAPAVPGAPRVLRHARVPARERHAADAARPAQAPAGPLLRLPEPRPLDLSSRRASR